MSGAPSRYMFMKARRRAIAAGIRARGDPTAAAMKEWDDAMTNLRGVGMARRAAQLAGPREYANAIHYANLAYGTGRDEWGGADL